MSQVPGWLLIKGDLRELERLGYGPTLVSGWLIDLYARLEHLMGRSMSGAIIVSWGPDLPHPVWEAKEYSRLTKKVDCGKIEDK